MLYVFFEPKSLWIFVLLFQFLAFSQLSNSNILVVSVKCLPRKYKLLPTFKFTSQIYIGIIIRYKSINFKILEVIKPDISKWNLYDKCWMQWKRWFFFRHLCWRVITNFSIYLFWKDSLIFVKNYELYSMCFLTDLEYVVYLWHLPVEQLLVKIVLT